MAMSVLETKGEVVTGRKLFREMEIQRFKELRYIKRYDNKNVDISLCAYKHVYYNIVVKTAVSDK